MNQTVGKERVRIAGVMERVLGLAVVNNVRWLSNVHRQSQNNRISSVLDGFFFLSGLLNVSEQKILCPLLNCRY